MTIKSKPKHISLNQTAVKGTRKNPINVSDNKNRSIELNKQIDHINDLNQMHKSIPNKTILQNSRTNPTIITNVNDAKKYALPIAKIKLSKNDLLKSNKLSPLIKSITQLINHKSKPKAISIYQNDTKKLLPDSIAKRNEVNHGKEVSSNKSRGVKIKKNTNLDKKQNAAKRVEISNNKSRSMETKNCILVDGQFDNEIRIAHIRDGKLTKYQHHSSENESLYGNIYYGIINKQYKHLDAAFIDIGATRHGFIQNFKENHRLFQVIKDAKGKKCATLTKNIAINGRYLILHPYNDLTKSKVNFNNPYGVPMCFTLKSKEQDINQDYLKKDAERLYKIWSVILEKTYSQPEIVYQDNDILINTVKSLDYNTTIIVEGKDTHHKICKISAEWAPDIKVKLYNRSISLFHHYAIEQKILDLQLQQMPLMSGGSITINQTEAMIAIDINSGKSNITIYKVNLEAAVLIAEQIKLRNLSGLIIVDFIDMQDTQQQTALYQKMKELLNEDYSYTKITQIPDAGAMEITRQRVLPSISENISVVCDRCDGNGFTLSTNCAAMQFLRNIRDQFAQKQHAGKTLEVYTTQEIGQFLLNHCRSALTQIEQRYNKIINIRFGEKAAIANYDIKK